MSDDGSESVGSTPSMPQRQTPLQRQIPLGPPPVMSTLRQPPTEIGLGSPTVLVAGPTGGNDVGSATNNSSASTPTPSGTQKSKFALAKAIPDNQIED